MSGMSNETEANVQLEIAHVLFLDIVGYSKLLINEQTEQIQTLKRIVRGTEQFQSAKAEGKLIGLPTGDGGALVFRTSLEAPLLCAIEISRRLKEHPELRVRMGIHSGPVNEVADLNEQMNMAGAGINVAQRVMDCGDAGHILLSQHVADDLEQYPRWQPQLHSLGECEVKHGVRIGVVNFYDATVGNSVAPKKFQILRKRRSHVRLAAAAAAVIVVAGTIFSFFLVSKPAMNWALTVPEKSIAVLPFENLSEDKSNSYFADGVQDEILEDLAKIADLKVISRTSVMSYKTGVARNLREIARELGVAHVVEGSVQRAANRIRVTAQLIDARNDSHVWAEHYDRSLDDVFAIQSEVAKTIVDQLHAKLTAAEKNAINKPPTNDLEAYDLYLRAINVYAESSTASQGGHLLSESERLLEEAIGRDPQFLAAWCTLADVNGLMYFWGHDHTPQRLAKEKAAVEAALKIDSHSGEAHVAKAMYLYRGYRDYANARAELAEARRTLPNNAAVYFNTGTLDYRQGNWDNATANLERALELDPRNLMYIEQMAICYEPQRRYSDERRMYKRALAIVPGDPSMRISAASVDASERADIKPNHETLLAVIAENPSNRELDHPDSALLERTREAAERALQAYRPEGQPNAYGVNVPRAYWEGVIARWQGDNGKARESFQRARADVEKTINEQPDYPAALALLGMIDAGLGRKDDAIREGRSACDLLPMTKDAVDGVAFVVQLAQVYTWTGEKDLAIETLAKALSVPSDCHYGELKLHPIWDPLRDDPRFEKLMEQSRKPFGVKKVAAKSQ
jgi:TolB-like protein/Flp pilus assembly protein TadD